MESHVTSGVSFAAATRVSAFARSSRDLTTLRIVLIGSGVRTATNGVETRRASVKFSINVFAMLFALLVVSAQHRDQHIDRAGCVSLVFSARTVVPIVQPIKCLV